MSLRKRIALVAGLAVGLAVVVAATIVYFGVRSQLLGEIDRTLEDRAGGVVRAPFAAPAPPPAGGAPPPRDGPRLEGPRGDRLRPPGPPRERLRSDEPFGGTGGYAQFVRSDGTVLRPPEAGAELPVTREVLELARSGSGRVEYEAEVDGVRLRVLAVGTGELGAVQAARSLEEVDRQLDRILVVLLLVALGGVALGAGLGGFVARIALEPVARFTRRTETLTGDPDLSQRIDASGDDELARLARSFNTTLDALERSAHAQRNLVADASHELRTPIASLRANIQVLEDADRLSPGERARLREDIVEELDGLTALVADVVELARGARPAAQAGDVRLDELVEQIADRARRRAGERAEIVTELEPAVVSGDPARIARAVTNLLDNAVRWTPEGGKVEVTLAGGTLSVRDHGPGFDPGDLPHVFERFYRAEQARGLPGSGLGLAIVRQAAESHGGRAEAANAPGGGAVVRVSFGHAARPDPAPLT